jgi:hypothetical protein
MVPQNRLQTGVFPGNYLQHVQDGAAPTAAAAAATPTATLTPRPSSTPIFSQQKKLSLTEVAAPRTGDLVHGQTIALDKFASFHLPRGRFYDYNFRRLLSIFGDFCQFSATFVNFRRKNLRFLKNQCYDKILHNLALFRVKYANFLSKCFSAKTFLKS